MDKIPIIEFEYDIKIDKVTKEKKNSSLIQLNLKNNNQFVNLNQQELEILGECAYKFRKGIGYKGEIYKLKFNKIGKMEDGKIITAFFYTYIKKGKFLKISDSIIELETKYIYPLVMSPHLKEDEFQWEEDKTYIIFPYEKNNKKPLSLDEIKLNTPLLYSYIKDNKTNLKEQSSYNKRIQNSGYWGVFRVGTYTYSKYYVVIRDNTRLNPNIITYLDTEWGEKKMPLFDGHISYISIRPDDTHISIEEAKYIKNKLKIAENIVLKIFDNRSISSRLPIKLPIYKKGNR